MMMMVMMMMMMIASNELCNDSQKAVGNDKFIMTYVGLCHLSEMYRIEIFQKLDVLLFFSKLMFLYIYFMLFN